MTVGFIFVGIQVIFAGFIVKFVRFVYMKKIVLFFLLLCFPYIAFSQTVRDSLTADIEAFAKDKNFVGFAVGIVSQDSLIYAKGFGYADKKANKPYTIQTLQPIASISKTAIGISLMKAQEMGKLNLDDDINQYLPFEIVNPYFPEEPITLRQLAMHTSTLKEPEYLQSYIFKSPLPILHEQLPEGTSEETRKSAEEDVKERMQYATNEADRIDIATFIKERFHPSGKYYKKDNFVEAKPGEEYFYTNEGAALAAYVLELATEMSFIDFTQQYIFDPLQMNATSWDHKSLDKPDEAHRSKLYYFGQEIPRFEDITYPDGELVTNIVDFSKYIRAMINGYNGQDNILKTSSYKEMMTKPENPEHESIFIEVDYKYTGYIGYSGYDMGIITLAHFFKDNPTGVIIFANTSHLDNLGNDLIQLYFLVKNYSAKLHPVGE